MSGAAEAVEGVRRFRPYPEYTKTGLSWIPEVPQHWRVTRLKNACSVRPSNVDKNTREGELPVRLCNYTDVYYNDRISSERDFMRASATTEEIRKFTLAAGDVLITKDSETADDIAIPAYVEKGLEGVLCGYHLAHIRPEPSSLIGAFVAHGFVADVVRDQFRIAANGITRFGLSLASIANSVFPAPPLDEQRAIAEFLDRETGKIDALVAKKERLIELLQEKRTALITHAVTKGLDPTAPTKPSGIDWLGDIPAHWEVKKLWHLTPDDRQIMYGIVLPGPNFDGGVPIVKGGDVKPGRLALDRLNRTTPEIEASYARSRLRGGDIVYAIRGSIGDAELVPGEISGANLTQDAARIAPAKGIFGGWLLYAVKSDAIFRQLEVGALGATIRGINIRDLKRASVPVPPPREQQSIAMKLDERARGINRLVETVQDGLAFLKEFRTALISAAVTGKIDVRDEAA